MKPKSNIQKGKRFEEYICQQIEEMGLGTARREIGSGSGKRKGDIFADLPFLIEAKNQKSLSWGQSIDQAVQQANVGNENPDKWALIVRDPRYPEFEKTYVVIDFHEFLKLLKKDSSPLIKEPDRQLKYALSRLKESINQVNKLL